MIILGILVFVLLFLQTLNECEGFPSWQELFQTFEDFYAWFMGIRMGVYLPVDILKNLPYTVFFAGTSLTLAILLSIASAIAEMRWPQRKSLKWLLASVKYTSFFPSVILGFIYLRVLEINMGLGPIVRPYEESVFPVMPYMSAILLLALGNGVYQDLRDGIFLELKCIMASDYVIAAKARGDTITSHVLRTAAIPLLSKAASKLGLFIGATLPLEILFNLPGIGRLAWEIVNRWVRTGIGSVFPLIALTVLLGVSLMAATTMIDGVRILIDPRMRTE